MLWNVFVRSTLQNQPIYFSSWYIFCKLKYGRIFRRFSSFYSRWTFIKRGQRALGFSQGGGEGGDSQRSKKQGQEGRDIEWEKVHRPTSPHSASAVWHWGDWMRTKRGTSPHTGEIGGEKGWTEYSRSPVRKLICPALLRCRCNQCSNCCLENEFWGTTWSNTHWESRRVISREKTCCIYAAVQQGRKLFVLGPNAMKLLPAAKKTHFQLSNGVICQWWNGFLWSASSIGSPIRCSSRMSSSVNDRVTQRVGLACSEKRLDLEEWEEESNLSWGRPRCQRWLLFTSGGKGSHHIHLIQKEEVIKSYLRVYIFIPFFTPHLKVLTSERYLFLIMQN